MPRVEEEVTQNVELVAYLHDLVREHPDFEVLCEPTVDPYCFRYVPNGLAEHKDQYEVRLLLDPLNEQIAHSVQHEGFALETITHVSDGVAIRILIYADSVREDVDATFEAIARWGRLCNKRHLSLVVS